MSSGRCGLCGNKFGQRAEELVHSDCVDEMNRKVDRLRERLDQFEAYAITVSSALADRAYIAAIDADQVAAEAALREISAECTEPPFMGDGSLVSARRIKGMCDRYFARREVPRG